MVLRVILESRFEEDRERVVERLQPTRPEHLDLRFLCVDAMIAVQGWHNAPDQVEATRSCFNAEANLIDARNRPLVAGRHMVVSGLACYLIKCERIQGARGVQGA
jgi:hypothetical protein